MGARLLAQAPAPVAESLVRVDGPPRALELGVRVALAHDYLLVMRGAERTFAEMAECFPESPIYTLLYDPDATGSQFAERLVRTSGLQRLSIGQDGFRAWLPLLPLLARRMRVEGADVVLSSSSAFAHGIDVTPGVPHVCYCHSPFRYAWHARAEAIAELPAPLRPLLRALLAGIRRWDVGASRRVTTYIANSQITRERIRAYWGRDAAVIYPPVDVGRFAPGDPDDYFVTVCELVRHKRVDIALEAARMAGRPIKVVGVGPEMVALRAAYGDRAEFLGRVSDSELAELMSRARALIVPGVEEFGIAAVEAQAAGRPVVAADAGGARETVIPGVTGVLVPPGDVGELARALREVDFDAFEQPALVRHAREFSTERFRERIGGAVAAAVEETADRRQPSVHLARRRSGRIASQADVPERELTALSPQIGQRRLVRRTCLAAANLLAAGVGFGAWAIGGDPLSPTGLICWPAILVLAILVSGSHGSDEARLTHTSLDEVPELFQAAGLAILGMLVIEGTAFGQPPSPLTDLSAWLGTTLALFCGRGVARVAARRSTPIERCLILGDGPTVDRVERVLERSPSLRARVVGRMSVSSFHGTRTGGPEVLRLVAGLQIHRVIADAGAVDDPGLADAVGRLRTSGVPVTILPRTFDEVAGRRTVEHLDGFPIVGLAGGVDPRVVRMMKRPVDVVAAGLGLLLLAPVFAVIAVLVRLDTPGPVLFRQRRVGRQGKTFEMLKFRTMADGAHDSRPELAARNESAGTFKLRLDPRVTRVGRVLRRASLDELPQLINVLRGEMSLVGPRPLVEEEDALIGGWHRRRLELTPGLTGAWQVLGPLRVPLAEMVLVDHLYVTAWSPWVDVKIVVRTVAHMIGGKGL